MRYWKSLQIENGKIVSGYDKSPWIVGEWREVPAPTRECEGLNCCESIIDAMVYVNMDVLAEVEIDGKQIVGDDKITVQRMRIIKAWKWEKMDSVKMSSYAAGLVEDNFNKSYPSDPRVKECNALVRKYIADPSSVTGDELRSAARSAWSAAWSAGDARKAMKKKIHNWIVKHTKELEVL
jgi:hypothetical protein